MTITNPQLCTTLEIWQPKYSAAYTATGERVALLAEYKLRQASPIVLVVFTKAPHLAGQRFAITREKALSFPTDSNGKIACKMVPMSAFEQWQSKQEEIQEVKLVIEEHWPTPKRSMNGNTTIK